MPTSGAPYTCLQCGETSGGTCAFADYKILKRGGVLGDSRFGVPDTLVPWQSRCGIIGQLVAVVLSMGLGLGLELVDESVCGVMMSIELIPESVATMLLSTAVASRLLEVTEGVGSWS
jgi:hypothetical protein